MVINCKTRAGLLSALSLLFGAFLLSRYIVLDPEMAQNMARGIASPLTWPRIMLSGMALFAFGWAVQGVICIYRSFKKRPLTNLSEADEAIEFGDVGFEHHPIPLPELPVVLGIVLALGYAFAIPWLGFPLATMIFLVLWFLLGGYRNPLKVTLVTIIGTVLLLYVFVKLALMPVSRGVGVLDNFTVALFRFLGIY